MGSYWRVWPEAFKKNYGLVKTFSLVSQVMKITYVGTLVLNARLAKNISQNKLAKKCRLLNGQYLSNLERGVCGPSLSLAKKLCRLLGISEWEFRSAMIKDYAANLQRKW